MAQMILRDYLQVTEDAISQGQLDNALARCQAILASYPESLDAQRLLGEVYLAQGHLDEAQQAFDWVLTNDPENVVAYCDRALISERLTDYDTALDCYQQAYELSRGNSQIRQAFNKLSAKTGQQGFMFSRAGLARLYMRGDLLTQAIQEWETVLAANPDRLDARTGLLEAYWHERLYNQVEQQARQILQDVPGCVKALLLLAYVIAARDMLQARELLHKVEALDPDLTLAHDLLSDAMASNPTDPFLQLLHKPPVMIDTALEQSISSDLADQDTRLQVAGIHAQPTSVQSAAVAASQNVPAMSDRTPNDASWNNIAGLKDLESSMIGQDMPTLSWSNNTYTGPSVWGDASNSASGVGEQHMPDFVAQLGEMKFSSSAWGEAPADAEAQATSPSDKAAQDEPWGALQGTLDDLGSAGPADVASSTFSLDSVSTDGEEPDTLSWDQQPSFSDLTFDGAWGSGQNAPTTPSSSEWTGASKNDLPSPPAWLSMLTQNDRKQMSGDLPVQTPSSSLQETTPPVEQQPATQPEMRPRDKRPVEPSVPAVAAPEDQDDESLFGPAWLKSLGAASMEAGLSAEMPAVTAVPSQPAPGERKAPSQPLPPTPYEARQPQPEPSITPSSTAPEAEQAPEPLPTPITPSHEALSSSQPQVRERFSPVIPEGSSWLGEGDDQDVLKTLEALEQELRLQGFTHLEPNTLAALARDRGVDVDATRDMASHQFEEPYREPSLSSALAELGDLHDQKPEKEAGTPAKEEQEVSKDVIASAPSPDVSWLPTPEPLPAPVAAEPEREAPPAEVYTEVPASTIQSSAAPVSLPQPVVSTDITEEKTVRAEPVKTSVARMNAFLENELETTMRRPAVRIPQGQRPGGQRNRPASIARNQSAQREGASATNVPAGASNISPNERLLRGYQHQLVGDYDEAMQEYRVIIRNSPELLGEVVSNVRALLKLAPKYAPGYRVLGDAYMRQGEYLQAMEAYNKALTMAKRAKA